MGVAQQRSCRHDWNRPPSALPGEMELWEAAHCPLLLPRKRGSDGSKPDPGVKGPIPGTHRLLPKPAGQRMGMGLRDPRRKRVGSRRKEEFGALPS